MASARGGLAQLGERDNGIVEVTGSSPVSSTIAHSMARRPQMYEWAALLCVPAPAPNVDASPLMRRATSTRHTAIARTARVPSFFGTLHDALLRGACAQRALTAPLRHSGRTQGRSTIAPGVLLYFCCSASMALNASRRRLAAQEPRTPLRAARGVPLSPLLFAINARPRVRPLRSAPGRLRGGEKSVRATYFFKWLTANRFSENGRPEVSARG